MRTFSYSDAKSHKFWTIDVTGTDFAVTYGKIGTAGQTAAKSFATAEKCQAEADKLVREKTGKGYVETTPKASVSDDEAFTKTLIARPDDRAAWSAYADYLTEQGDPRGEFMAVQIALEDESLPKAERAALKKTEAKLLKAHERDWLGPLAAFTLDFVDDGNSYSHAQVTHTFRRGWVTELRISALNVGLARAIVKATGLQFLLALLIETQAHEVAAGAANALDTDGTFEPGPDIPADVEVERGLEPYHVMSRFPHFASVRRFRLGYKDSGGYDNRNEPFLSQEGCHTEGSFAHHFVKQMPNVEEIVLRAREVDTAKLFALPMPNLRHLAVDHITNYPLEKLAENKTVTKLTHLICYPHAINIDEEDQTKAYIRLKQLKAVCRAGWPLEFLRLRLTDFGNDGAKEIAASGVLKHLKYLDLTGGCITDEGVEALANCLDLKRLDALNLDQNAMTDAGTSRLKAVMPKVSFLSQHTTVPPFDGSSDIEFLFMGDCE